MGSTLDTDAKITGTVQVGNATNPPTISGGSGAMSTTNKANGSMHLRTDEPPEVLIDGVINPIGCGQHALECRLSTLVANSANVYTTYIPRKAKITGISRRWTVDPASASGTVVTGITVDGNQVLQSASEDEEAVGNDTLTAYTLTATSSYLDATKGDKVVITVTSNNADMTDGTGGMVYIYYEDA